jgi:tripartite-type tricarboxylate transporter receptor subunit TctC
MMSRRHALRTSAIFAAGAACLLAQPAAAQPSDFYAGKTINFIVGTDVGGGFSIYGRALTRHLGRFIPGKPALVMRNMPGAGGATSAQYLFRIAPKDGTVIGSVSPNAILGRLLDGNVSQYDPAKFQYLAGAERGTRLCMTYAHSKTRTFEDAFKHRTVIGATSAGSPTREYAAMVKHSTGAQFEIVSGYKGPPDLFLAMARGEIDGVCGLDWSALKSQQPDWLREKKLNILIQASMEPDPELAGLGVPTPWKFMKSDIDRQAVEVMIGFQQAFGKSYLVPPEVPAERVRVLREAFAAALKDPEFLAEANKLRIEITPQSGEDVQRIVQQAYSAPASVIDRLRTIIEP